MHINMCLYVCMYVFVCEMSCDILMLFLLPPFFFVHLNIT